MNCSVATSRTPACATPLHNRASAHSVAPRALVGSSKGPLTAAQSARRARSTVARVSFAGAAASTPATPKARSKPSPKPKSSVSPLLLDAELARSATHKELEVFESLKPVFEKDILPLLPPAEDLWQPSDFLPDPTVDADFYDAVRDLRKRTAGLPDDLLVCIVGDAITEEALPTYMNMLNTLGGGVRDETGRDMHPYARWTRAWIAEENRHGDLLSRYMYLTGRVNMKAVEITTQKLVTSGMDPGTQKHPYNAFVFTSFQERATKISHGSTARKAAAAGDDALAAICGTIARDESRHEAAYTRTIDAVFERDPDGAMLAFARMMARKITMPAHLMDDGTHGPVNEAVGAGEGRNLFADFSSVAERSGVYTAHDYVGIIRHLIRRWNVAGRTGLSDVAGAARDFLCALPDRFERLAERRSARSANVPPTDVAFSWVFDRKVPV